MRRKIIIINDALCNGCGLCIPNCPEGAMQVIEGRVRLVSDLFCDGLGACVGHCPEGALTVEEREAETYDEKRVMANIIGQGSNVVKAHLTHLLDHGETGYYNEAREFLIEEVYDLHQFEPASSQTNQSHHGCPGARTIDMTDRVSKVTQNPTVKIKRESELSTWPVQLQLVNPLAPYFQDKDVLFTADCVAYTLADFHSDYLKGKSLIIACPKLDNSADVYIEKLTVLFDEAGIASLSVMIMEVPCCSGIVSMVEGAMKKSKRKIPFTVIRVGIRGIVLAEETVEV